MNGDEVCTAALPSFGGSWIFHLFFHCKAMFGMEGCINSLEGIFGKKIQKLSIKILTPRRADSSVGNNIKYRLHLEAYEADNCLENADGQVSFIYSQLAP